MRNGAPMYAKSFEISWWICAPTRNVTPTCSSASTRISPYHSNHKYTNYLFFASGAIVTSLTNLVVGDTTQISPKTRPLYQSPGCGRPWSSRVGEGSACDNNDNRQFEHQTLVATSTQIQRNPIVQDNLKGRICHTPINRWLIYLGYIGFTLQITFGA